MKVAVPNNRGMMVLYEKYEVLTEICFGVVVQVIVVGW